MWIILRINPISPTMTVTLTRCIVNHSSYKSDFPTRTVTVTRCIVHHSSYKSDFPDKDSHFNTLYCASFIFFARLIWILLFDDLKKNIFFVLKITAFNIIYVFFQGHFILCISMVFFYFDNLCVYSREKKIFSALYRTWE